MAFSFMCEKVLKSYTTRGSLGMRQGVGVSSIQLGKDASVGSLPPLK